jgi:predicted RNA-binding protein with PUA-like domain
MLWPVAGWVGDHFDFNLYTYIDSHKLKEPYRQMTYFLAKTDPETYSFEDLERDKTTTWDGVRSPQAVRVIQSMHPGDALFIYHSMGEAAIVGLARVTSEPRPDPVVDKSWVVDVAFVRRLTRQVTLREIKTSHLFDDWSLVRQSRLSTMSVPDAFIAWLKEQAAW